MNRSRIALLITALLAGTAHADIDVDDQRRIDEIERAISDSRDDLPQPITATTIAAHLQDLAYQTASMSRGVEHAKSLLPTIQHERAAYDRLRRDLADLEALHGRIQLLLSADWAAVLAKHQRGEPADAELEAVAAALTRIAAGTAKDKWAASHVAAFKKFLAALRVDNVKVSEAAARQRTIDTSAAKATTIADTVKQTRALATQLAQRALAGGTLDPAEIARVETAVTALDKQDAGLFLRVDLLGLRMLERWEQADGDAQQAIATLLGGELESHGRSKGKKLGVKIAAAADRCYLLLAHYAAQADEAQISRFEWTLARGHQVQAFRVRPFVHLAEGFCTLQKETVTASAELTFQGTKNAVRWSVVSFARDQFPAVLAGGLEVERGDHCDPKYWEAMWTRPIPGTIAYAGREPVVVLSPSVVVASEVIRLNDLSASSVSGVLTSKPTAGSVKFSPQQLLWVSCPDDSKEWLKARAPASLATIDCDKRVEKKYAGAWARIERQQAAARAAGGIAPAVEDRAAALMAQQDRDSEKCLRFGEAAQKAIEKVNERLIDKFLTTPPSDPTERADRYFRAAKWQY